MPKPTARRWGDKKEMGMVDPSLVKWNWKIIWDRYFDFYIEHSPNREFTFYHFGWLYITHYKSLKG